MKRIFTKTGAIAALGLLLLASGCKKDKKMVLVPELTTTAYTAVDNTSGASGGTITSDGGAELTSVGVYYSKTNQTPGSSDTEVTGSLTGGTFSVQLTGLSTGSTYYIRAYATNSAGTGYGQVLTFMTGNSAPVATEVKVNGEIGIGKELTAAYSYSDAESDPESGTSFQWYSATDAAGAGEAAISGATAAKYTPAAAEEFKFIRVGVTPKSSAGTTTGAEVKSPFVGPMPEAAETVTFTYNGHSVTYGVIESSTGKKWLDRNLGSPRVANANDDYRAYGDLFQWGRSADGHQLISRISTTESTAVNATITVGPLSTISPGSNFITVEYPQQDWLDPANNNLWKGVDKTNNPCPQGWRIPTKDEWAAEIVLGMNTIQKAYELLKLTRTGYRQSGNGNFLQPSVGVYWSVSPYDFESGFEDYIASPAFYTFPLDPLANGNPRGDGLAIRCIKD